jgi:DNA polymerase-3 subunit delta'
MGNQKPILCFTEVLGQEKARNLVSRTMKSGRLPHAYIFKGPDGVGKRLFARGVAAALNCRGEMAGRACGVCSSCKKFLSGNHPDFMVVKPEKGTIKIDQVREMCRALSYPPYESDLRIVLLEDVHTMRQEAANSLLKTLEEPPPANLLILTAEASQEILTTISSRCQVIPFYGLAEADCVSIILDQQLKLEPESARVLSRLAEGSPGQALVLHETEMIGIIGKILSTVCDPQIDGNRDVGELLKVAEEMAELKENLLPLLGLLRLWLRDTLFALSGSGGHSGLYGFGLDPGKTSKSWSSKDLFAKLEAINRAEKELKRNCNRTLVCEVLLFHLHEETLI